jgi:hypothetical protein
MSLRYGLHPYKLSKNANDYKAVIADNETIGEEELIEEMIGKGSTVSKAEALAVIEEYESAMCKAIQDGKTINTRMFKIYPSIKGLFNGESDHFSSNRHQVQLNIRAGKRLKSITKDLELEKVELPSPTPTVKKFEDLKTGLINKSSRAGDAVLIQGSLLKFDPTDDHQGIFFIDQNRKETKVSNIIKNKPSELIFLVPDNLPTGKYLIEIRVIRLNYKSLKSGKLSSAIHIL